MAEPTPTPAINRPTRAIIAAKVLQAISAEYSTPLSHDGAVIKDAVETTAMRVTMSILSVPIAYICTTHALSELMLDLGQRSESREFVVAFASRFLLEMEEYDVARWRVIDSIAQLCPVNDAVFSDKLADVILGWPKGIFGEGMFARSEKDSVPDQVFQQALNHSLFLTGIFLIALYCRAVPHK